MRNTMNDSSLGRGPFVYMCVIVILNILVLAVLFFIDADRVLNTARKPGLLELATLLYVLELMVYVIWSSVLSKGWGSTLLALCLTFVIAFAAEAAGVNFGLVFGSYYYTEALSLRVVGVPLLVALAWEPILYASYRLSSFILPAGVNPDAPLAARLVPYLFMAGLGALATTAWDLMMDPFAVNQGWWVWPQGGPYVPYVEHGVPISNFMGWLKVSFVCQLVIRVIMDHGRPLRHSVYLSVYGPILLYAMLLVQSGAVCLIFLKRPEVPLIGLMSMGSICFIAVTRVILLKRGRGESAGTELLRF